MEAIEIISAFALSLSFILLIWTIKGFLLRPAAAKSTSKVTIVIIADEKTKNLDRELERLRWLREDGLLVADILLVDTGMNAETAQIADSLLRNNPSLRICRPEELANIITRGIGNGAEG
ncbi:MAG: hypothetical protein KBI01_06865 [Oscillospiraceae bacterium]|nr:hypothetical protein [Oscillospiraceae bacterium]